MPSVFESKKVAFVLPGGGSFGAIQVGMLKALFEHGIVPDLIVGCSVGAFNSAYVAAAPDLEGITRLESIWRTLKRKDVFQINRSMFWSLIYHREAFFSTGPLEKLIETHLPVTEIEKSVLPLHILAADFVTGEPLVFSNGSIKEAILASSAVPGAFAPIKYGGRFLTDGALANITPLRVAADLGATRIILLPVSVPCMMTHPLRGAMAHISHAVNLLMARQVLADCRELAKHVEISVVPPLCPLDGSPHTFVNTATLIDRAYQTTAAWMDGGHYDSCELPPAIFPQRHT